MECIELGQPGSVALRLDDLTVLTTRLVVQRALSIVPILIQSGTALHAIHARCAMADAEQRLVVAALLCMRRLLELPLQLQQILLGLLRRFSGCRFPGG